MQKAIVRGLADKYASKVIDIRRNLHMYPELSFQEVRTSGVIQEILTMHHIPFTTGWAGHGVVGILECKNPRKANLALRADMDALPIQENNDVSYKSCTPGVMHACGHDVHTASLLGAAMILAELRDQIQGTIKFIFQPAEEKLPGGASMMIAEGVLGNPVPTGILGQHVHPQLPVGEVGFRSGQAMASSDEITIRIIGKGGHGAMPHQAIDPVLIAANVITSLQSIVSRLSDPTIPSVLTFGKLQSEGGAFNVIPDTVVMQGTFRTFDENWRKNAHKKIVEVTQGITTGFGATCLVSIETGYPVLINDEHLTNRCKAAAIAYLGSTRVHDIPARLTSEDFAHYTHQVPGCFYRLGVANTEKGIVSPVHTPTFDIDEDALVVGAGLMAWLAISELQTS